MMTPMEKKRAVFWAICHDTSLFTVTVVVCSVSHARVIVFYSTARTVLKLCILIQYSELWTCSEVHIVLSHTHNFTTTLTPPHPMNYNWKIHLHVKLEWARWWNTDSFYPLSSREAASLFSVSPTKIYESVERASSHIQIFSNWVCQNLKIVNKLILRFKF